MAKARRQDGVTMQDLPLPKVYGLLEPGPIVFLTTADRGRANVMTLSWHMMVEFTPPLVAFVVSRTNYSQAHFTRDNNVSCFILIPLRSGRVRSQIKEITLPGKRGGCAWPVKEPLKRRLSSIRRRPYANARGQAVLSVHA